MATSKKSPQTPTKTVVAKPTSPQVDVSERVGRLVYILLVISLLVLLWYKTNSWPIVAVVNYRPIWSWDLNNMMYAQVGEQALDNIITENVIKDELDKQNVQVSESDVDAKIDEIKKQIGSDESFEQALAMQGMTSDQLREQIKLQLGLEKLVEPSTDSAKMQEDVYAKVQDLRGSSKVWTVKRN